MGLKVRDKQRWFSCWNVDGKILSKNVLELLDYLPTQFVLQNVEPCL